MGVGGCPLAYINPPPPPLLFTPRLITFSYLPLLSRAVPEYWNRLRRERTFLRHAAVLEDFGSASTSSAASLIRSPGGRIFSPLARDILEVLHVWHSSSGWTATRLQRRRRLGFLDNACAGA